MMIRQSSKETGVHSGAGSWLHQVSRERLLAALARDVMVACCCALTDSACM